MTTLLKVMFETISLLPIHWI